MLIHCQEQERTDCPSGLVEHTNVSMMHDPRRASTRIETLDQAGRERLRTFKGVSERGGDGK